jgi:hypothetical protein
MILNEIEKIKDLCGGSLKEKKGVYQIDAVIAERKVFLSKKKLEYQARVKVDEAKKEVCFFEMLKESSSGLSSGGDLDSPGVGFKFESYKTSAGQPREGMIQEQSRLFSKTYEYKFDFSTIHGAFREAVEREGYTFIYKTLPF